MTIEDKCKKFLKLLFRDYNSDDYKTWIRRFESGHPELYMDGKSLYIYHDMIFKHHPDIPQTPDNENEYELMWVQNPAVVCNTAIREMCEKCSHSKIHIYNKLECKNKKCLRGYNDCICHEKIIYK
jgi:hypothetical protein